MRIETLFSSPEPIRKRLRIFNLCAILTKISDDWEASQNQLSKPPKPLRLISSNSADKSLD